MDSQPKGGTCPRGRSLFPGVECCGEGCRGFDKVRSSLDGHRDLREKKSSKFSKAEVRKYLLYFF